MPPSERSFRTPALILKRFDLGEADRLLTVLTPTHGKLEVVAKGARKLTSAKTGHVELFTRADMLINTGRELGVVVQAEMTSTNMPLRENLERGAYAAYAAEISDRFITSGEYSPKSLFDLLDDTFTRAGEDDDPRLAVRYFEMQLLDLVGFRPELNECVIGREDIKPEDQFFSYAEGGVICPRDAMRGTSFVPISVTTLKLMRHMQRSRYEAVRGLIVPTPLHEDVERVMVGYISFLLERRPHSADMLRRLR